MQLSPDGIIYWQLGGQLGFVKLNATIVFTWGLMFILAVGSKSLRATFPRIIGVPAGRIFWKWWSSASRNKLRRSA